MVFPYYFALFPSFIQRWRAYILVKGKHMMEARKDEMDSRQDQMQMASLHLTDALKRDSAAMKIISILTVLFLPGTFIAVCAQGKLSQKLSPNLPAG